MISTAIRPDRGRREHTFCQMADHVRAFCSSYPRAPREVIVETGTTANPIDYIGAGNSTQLWNHMVDAGEVRAISIDIDPAAIRMGRLLAPSVHFMCGDAAEVLRYMPAETVNQIRLLYLDSMWDPTGLQALRELLAIWHRLQPGCMIAIDDRHSDDVGKHVATQHFMDSLGIGPVFKDYQIGWVKP